MTHLQLANPSRLSEDEKLRVERVGVLQIKTSVLALCVGVLAIPVLSGCEGDVFTIADEGSGVAATEQRDVGRFTSIDVSGALNLRLTVDASAEPSVIVTFDDNLIERVITRVEGDTLILDIDGTMNLTGNNNRFIAVSVADIETIRASGATDVEATGMVRSYGLNASGASDIDAEELIAGQIEVDISGASGVDLYATDAISGSVSGASRLRIHGDPQQVSVESSGASNVSLDEG